ncbi:MAG: ABC transporter ATP-binding protein [Deinococcota bacterium]
MMWPSPPTSTGPAVRVGGLVYAYANKPVLNGLSFEVRAGELLALLGHNGAGKTTTFRILAGLLRPDAGEVVIGGVNLRDDPKAARAACAFLPDEPLLYTQLSALENLAAYAALWGVPSAQARERARALLQEADLWAVRHALTSTYSRGMKQKLAICAALLHQPRVLLMDEPLSGLDVEASMWARALLRSFVESGGAVVFTSHTPELVEAVADRVLILRGGVASYEAVAAQISRDGGLLSVFQRDFAGSPLVFTEGRA